VFVKKSQRLVKQTIIFTFDAVGHVRCVNIPLYQGGFVTDGGVHHIAALRLMGGEVTRVNGAVAHNKVKNP
jgi:hypothetical protein